MTQTEHRCGFVAVVGRPNVGKSTLINALVGSKVSIVAPKPQTTRHRILGVRSSADAQLIFVDTPGLHDTSGKAMNRMMNRTASAALGDADVVMLVCEAERWTAADEHALKRLRSAAPETATKVAVLNKVDRVKHKPRLLESIAGMAERYAFSDIVPVSAKRGDNLERLVDVLVPYLPVSQALYTDGMLSDRDAVFRAAEFVREKLTIELRDELPYGLTVQIERYDESDERLVIDAVIWVERTSQKGIVIGKGGALLKKVGRSARLDIARECGKGVHLELWVKVKENWADNEADLQKLGYDMPT